MSRAKPVENKKKPRVAAGPEAPGFARSMGENIGRVLRSVVPLIAILSTAVLISWLLWRPLHAGGVYAESESAAASKGRLSDRVLEQSILQKPRPPWISREDYEATARLGLVAQNHSIFEPNLSRNIALQLSASPWVESVHCVRLRYPAQVDIDIDWRRPEARIETPSPMVIDRRGFVLNLMADNPAVSDTPKIAGLNLAHAESAGKQIVDGDVQDALRLLSCVRDTLNNSAGHLKVAVLERDLSRKWRIVTDHGPAIKWGFFTDDPPMDEPRTNKKLELLSRRLSEAVDPGWLEYISVYTDQAPVKRRDAAAPPPVRAIVNANQHR